MDRVAVVNDLVDLEKKSKKSCFIFKVDFEKACDSVSWSFLDYTLSHFGFNDKWRGWIRVCMFSYNPVTIAIFLFLLKVEGLSGFFSRAVN